jgi:hypothetical protein
MIFFIFFLNLFLTLIKQQKLKKQQFNRCIKQDLNLINQAIKSVTRSTQILALIGFKKIFNLEMTRST